MVTFGRTGKINFLAAAVYAFSDPNFPWNFCEMVTSHWDRFMTIRGHRPTVLVCYPGTQLQLIKQGQTSMQRHVHTRLLFITLSFSNKMSQRVDDIKCSAYITSVNENGWSWTCIMERRKRHVWNESCCRAHDISVQSILFHFVWFRHLKVKVRRSEYSS